MRSGSFLSLHSLRLPSKAKKLPQRTSYGHSWLESFSVYISIWSCRLMSNSIILTCCITKYYIFSIGVDISTAPYVRQVQPFVCEKCGRTYKNKTDLKRHFTYECGVTPSFSCKCEYRAKRKFNLKEHLINVHAGVGLSLLKA